MEHNTTGAISLLKYKEIFSLTNSVMTDPIKQIKFIL